MSSALFSCHVAGVKVARAHLGAIWVIIPRSPGFDTRAAILLRDHRRNRAMQIDKVSGAALAAAAAMLFTSGLASVSVAAESDAGMVKCTGVNSCKGQSDCKSAKNSCKGKNSCQGEGFKKMSPADCDAARAKMK